MSQWLKTLTGCLCILTVLMHLIPKGRFSVYVRFYGGLLFFLVAAGPIWKLLAGEGELERLLQLEFLRTDYYDLESSVEGMAELKNERIREAYRGEIARQVEEIALAYGIRAEKVQLSFDGDGYRLTGLSFDAVAAPGATADMPGTGEEKGWGTDGTDPAVPDGPGMARENGQGEDDADFGAAAESVRQEIAGVYSLDLNQIHIRTGESGQWKNGWTG